MLALKDSFARILKITSEKLKITFKAKKNNLKRFSGQG